MGNVQQNIYSSSDFNLVSYLLSKWLSYVKIECRDKNTNRCTFVLSIPTHIDLPALLTAWSSEESDHIKEFARQWKLMRAEIKKFFAWQK